MDKCQFYLKFSTFHDSANSISMKIQNVCPVFQPKIASQTDIFNKDDIEILTKGYNYFYTCCDLYSKS